MNIQHQLVVVEEHPGLESSRFESNAKYGDFAGLDQLRNNKDISNRQVLKIDELPAEDVRFSMAPDEKL